MLKERIEKLKEAKKKKRETLSLKYLASLEEIVAQKDEIIKLKSKIISLQEDNDIYQKVIIEDLKKDIQKEKVRFKKLKELGL